ncbi:histidine kinase N-terminal 7TM domain-containing protein [Angustibacter aerolatus]
MRTTGALVALCLGAVLYLAITASVWRHRRAVGARALVLLLLAGSAWTLFAAAEVGAADPQVQERWGDAKYLGIVLLGPALLVFALQYTGRRPHLRRRWLAALAVEPVVVLALLSVPATHDLVRHVPDDAPSGVYAYPLPGPLFWPVAVWTYLLVVAATIVIVLGVARVARPHPWRATLLIGSMALPLLLNALYNAELLFTGDVDPTPMGFSIAGIVLVWGFFRFRLVDLVPVGRRQVFDRIPDGVLVLDLLGRVVDANPAAGRLAGRARGALVGAVAGEVLPALHPLLRSTAAGESATGSEVLPAADGVRRDVEVTISPLPDDASEPSGRLVVVRDVSAQRSVERRLRELVAERQTTIDTLQRGLVPARLPHVPGLDVAAALDPAEAETNVGGDFLDLRAVGDGRWACMIGDVVGKGAGAATLTALARHTAVALSGLGWVPSRVLAAVAAAVAAEEAVGDPDADPRFCTMALATLEPVPGGAEVVLSLGGHPRPFVVSASGSVTEVGRPGSLLGVVDPPRLHDELVRLRAGDALVLFTDGVTETRRGLEPFGDDQLVRLLGSLAGRSADRVVRSLVEAVRTWGEPHGAAGGAGAADARDDVAVLVVAVPAG